MAGREKLPRLSGAEAAPVFGRFGWAVKRRHGAHIILVKLDGRYNLFVPDHDELKAGTLRSLIRKAGLTVDEFIRFLR